MRLPGNVFFCALAAVALAGSLAGAPTATAQDGKSGDDGSDADVLLDALVAELGRSHENLRDKGDDPLYYLSYRVEDGRRFSISASFGSLEQDSTRDPYGGRRRTLDVSARVGSHELDNTHKVRGEFSFGGFGGGRQLPIEDDAGAIRVAVWRATDSAYKEATRQLIRVKTNKAVKVEEEDQANDFSREEPAVYLGERKEAELDLDEWKERCKRLSAIFKTHPLVLSSSVTVTGGEGTLYFVDSDGARIREPRYYLRFMVSAQVRADDGMDLNLFDSVEATTNEQLPTEEALDQLVRDLIARLEALREAPTVEPYSGPAIIMNRAASVFFHEIFGHRVEGHRQKDEEEGQTFTKKVDERIMPEFISVKDDPTQRRFGETPLNGFYRFDEEGVAARSVSLVEDGVLKGFLMGRSPIDRYPNSNGHGRAQPGLAPVARQGNLLASSSKQVPFPELRKMLIEEIRKQGKTHGLIFQDITGGFTFTGRYMPQAFKVIPLVVYKVYPDGRPDELVRGVDLVGTPLASLEKIVATGDDYAVFNGYCGAESGYVPVSAVAPSLLVAEMEVEKKQKGVERLPILPPPLHPDMDWPPDKGKEDESPDGPGKDDSHGTLREESR